MIGAFIIQAGNLFDSFIVDNVITISEMPAVQTSALFLEHEEVFEQIKK